MTRAKAEKIRKGIDDKIRKATVDMEWWTAFWGFTVDEYEEFLDMATKALEQEPTAEYSSDVISRQDVVTEIHKYFVEEIDKTSTRIDEDGDEVYTDMPTVNSLLACNKELSKRIKALSSAEPKRGYWLDAREEDPCWFICSECKTMVDADYNYCPHCGCAMERGEEE